MELLLNSPLKRLVSFVNGNQKGVPPRPKFEGMSWLHQGWALNRTPTNKNGWCPLYMAPTTAKESEPLRGSNSIDLGPSNLVLRPTTNSQTSLMLARVFHKPKPGAWATHSNNDPPTHAKALASERASRRPARPARNPQRTARPARKQNESSKCPARCSRGLNHQIDRKIKR